MCSKVVWFSTSYNYVMELNTKKYRNNFERVTFGKRSRPKPSLGNEVRNQRARGGVPVSKYKVSVLVATRRIANILEW